MVLSRSNGFGDLLMKRLHLARWSNKIPCAHGVGGWVVGDPSEQVWSSLRLWCILRLGLRNGSRVLFWQNVWCGDSSLRLDFLIFLE